MEALRVKPIFEKERGARPFKCLCSLFHCIPVHLNLRNLYRCRFLNVEMVSCGKAVERQVMLFTEGIGKFELIIRKVRKLLFINEPSNNEIDVAPSSGDGGVSLIAKPAFEHSLRVEDIQVKFAAYPFL